jgi:hypothetical protein
VALFADVAPFIGSRFDCCDLLQRSVIHYGAERKTSSARVDEVIGEGTFSSC